jgi:hypothetical protein
MHPHCGGRPEALRQYFTALDHASLSFSQPLAASPAQPGRRGVRNCECGGDVEASSERIIVVGGHHWWRNHGLFESRNALQAG